MLVTERLQLPLPPRTGSHWVDMAMRYLSIPCWPLRGRHRIPQPGDSAWRWVPPKIKRFTIVREPVAWLRSIYRTAYPARGHMGIPALRSILCVDVDSEDAFVEESLRKVSAMWDYYQPADYTARSEDLATGLITALLDVGYDINAEQRKVLRASPPINVSHGNT